MEDLGELEEELEWADKRPNRIIIVYSVPSQIGNDRTIMRQVEDICQGREHVELTFSEAGNAASMLFESMTITAPGHPTTGSGGGGGGSGGGARIFSEADGVASRRSTEALAPSPDSPIVTRNVSLGDRVRALRDSASLSWRKAGMTGIVTGVEGVKRTVTWDNTMGRESEFDSTQPEVDWQTMLVVVSYAIVEAEL